MGEGLSFVRVGTLGEAARFTLDVHIFTSLKQPWAVFSSTGIFEGKTKAPLGLYFVEGVPVVLRGSSTHYRRNCSLQYFHASHAIAMARLAQRQ